MLIIIKHSYKSFNKTFLISIGNFLIHINLIVLKKSIKTLFSFYGRNSSIMNIIIKQTPEIHFKPLNFTPQIFTIFLILSSFATLPYLGLAQTVDTSKPDTGITKGQTNRFLNDTIKHSQYTHVKGKITDAITGKPVIFVRANFVGSNYGVNSNEQGNYEINFPGVYKQIKFSLVGYKTVIKSIVPGEILNIKLEGTQTQLNEVVIHSAKRKKYKNKDNPSVELIQQVIDHKNENRAHYANYLQFDQYERITMSLIDLSPEFLNGNFFRKYRFLLDTTQVVNGKVNSILPIYMTEKLFHNYYRKEPSKSISILGAHKEVDFSTIMDPQGLDFYLNRLYGQVDMYENNIFILTNQFLSPIADHSPNYYKFFISDTIKDQKEKLIEISFVPRNRGDLLFEGKLYITMDGKYAVKAVDMKIDKQINLNFLRLLQIHQDFEKNDSSKYYLVKSSVKADFGVLKNKGFGFSGERTLTYKNYKEQSPMPEAFYNGKSDQVIPDTVKQGPDYWKKTRGDTLNDQQAKLYKNIDSLKNMPSFKRTIWVTHLIAGGYGDIGPFQFGPVDATYTFNSVEGTRFRLGGRSTPAFNKSFYVEAYGAYGLKDEQFKYYGSLAYSFNQAAPYLYPNNYLKVSYQYDTDIPGQNFLITRTQSLLASFKRGTNNLWLYNTNLRLNYARDFENHFSFDVGLKNWQQHPAGTLVFQASDQSQPVTKLTTTELDVLLRYAPHEKFIQGSIHRFTIPSKYPIISLAVNSGISGFMNGQYSYYNISTNVYKRFYLSQLGYTDVTLQAGTVIGQVPFPLLSILPANQTYLYNKYEYNMMNFLEFVSDHYAGLNLTHNFGGFFLNKIPVIESFKLREILSLKVLYGGLRDENNPAIHSNLYKFPINADGSQATFALGDVPYIEAGAGIGNIFKVLRLDVIHRFNYLNHSGTAAWGLRFSFTPDL